MKKNSIAKEDIIFITILYVITVLIFVLLVITISNQKKTVEENIKSNTINLDNN